MPNRQHYTRADLDRLAVSAMVERGLKPEFSAGAVQQMAQIQGPSGEAGADISDLRHLLWCSIDNDDSRDLDQLSVCEQLPQGAVKVWVAIADVDTLVRQGSPVDHHAQANTTSVYTSVRIFPMLPERLSTNLTSLNPGEDRLAMVTEMVFNADATLAGSVVYRARVHNHAKLAYDAVSAWIEGEAALPAAAAAVPGMDVQLRTQDALAQVLQAKRRAEGSLDFESFQPRAVFDGDRVVEIRQQAQNRARQLIAELMIATNGCTARFLADKGSASLRRVVQSPERWLRIVGVAKEYGEDLPSAPDSKALEQFLLKRRKADPLRFPDLSLIIVKLMGRGEYVMQAPGTIPMGHFGLAVRDYTHATAPNRRFPDLITSRLVKSALLQHPATYSNAELAHLAEHCTAQEEAAQKVERQMRKSEAAMVLQTRLGERFEGVVTGASDKGVWVRVFAPPCEGRLHGPNPSPKVGDKVRAKLVSTDVERGFIDFEILS
jgi:exoribonuclease II